MSNLRSASVLFTLGVLALAGCGGSDSGGGAPGGGLGATGPTLAELPAKFAQVSCDVANQCFGADVLKIYLGGEDCLTRTQRAIEDGDIGYAQQLVTDKKLTYDAAKAQACLDAYRAGGCAQLDMRAPAACNEVFGGKGAAGDACQIGAECSPGMFCQAGAACPGKCAALQAAGAACTDDDQCADGLKCTGGVCAAPAAEGEACGGGTKLDCKSGLACAGADDKTQKPGVCKQGASLFSVKKGETCDASSQKFCEIGATCELSEVSQAGIKWTCVAPYTSGGPCKLGFPGGCPSGEYCPVVLSGASPKLDAVCTKIPAAGEACGPGTDGTPTTCGPNAVCVGGKCADKQRVGGTCSSDEACYSEHCRDGKCIAGLSCEPDAKP
ncbi:MAG: hypothetical protein IT374_10605 [Polyangiaceae bacterium]|nr:hypothetical protein [Polyangiaceae bacterium]